VKTFDDRLMAFLDDPARVVAAACALLALLLALLYRDQVWFYARMIAKSLRRNLVRTALTSMATFVFVLSITMVGTILYVLNLVTTEKARDFKAIVTERWQIPSQMPFAYAASLSDGGARKTGDVHPDDSMTWSFVGGTIDPNKRTRENIVFFFGMDPAKLLRVERDERGNMKRDADGRVIYTSMMDGMDELTDEQLDLLDKGCREMEKDRRKVIIGKERLAAMNKKVGERFTLTGLNYFGMEFEVEVIGEFPEGRYNQSALMNREYVLESMDAWKRKNGRPHPMADKCLNLVWLRVPDSQAFRQMSDQIMTSPEFTVPAVKVETASSGIASFLDGYRSILWGMQWLFVPAVLFTMALVIAGAISISVRERRTEMAVLKVLGFSPTQILVLVLGEALLVGVLSGLASALAAYSFINLYLGGIKFPIAFFPAFRVPTAALWWGPAIGALTAFAGSVVPAWSARQVKVAEVFAKTA
jgi:putative ABC transport system permease protein